MSTPLPRLVVAAPASGQGKTTVATGLMAALRHAGDGLGVSGHKVGPDYIDPGFYAVAGGRPGRNLDPHLVGEERVVPLLLHGARGADVAVVEGVMGLYDGRVGADGYASTAHVAALTDSPVLLVVDASAASRTVAAVVHGLATFDPSVRVAGVVLNKVGSPRHVGEIEGALARTGVPVLGALPRDGSLSAPSRHLGLVPAAERDETVALVERLGARLSEHVDLDAVMTLARSAPPLAGEAWDPAAAVGAPVGAGAGRPVVAMAGGRAFTFRYAETEELLRAAGCDVVGFDPATDRSLPPGTAGIYLGGGFPEVHATGLAGNEPLRRELREAVADGVPTVAECAGLLYLCRELDGQPMVGAIDASAAMTERLTLAYPSPVAAADTLLTRAGETVTGHEFHRTRVSPASGAGTAGSPGPAWTVDGRDTGFASATLHASYLHVHWAGHPQLARRFADAVHDHASARTSVEPGRDVSTSVGPGEDGPSLVEPGHEVAGVETNTVGARATSEVLVSTPLAGARGLDQRAEGLDQRAEGLDQRAEGLDQPSVDLWHHGDVEVRGQGLVDLAVNVYAGPRPAWLDDAILTSLGGLADYPDARPAEAALAAHHGRTADQVLATAGAAEAFGLIARLRPWRRPVVVHPQFAEPHAALEQAGHAVTTVLCREEDGFVLDPAAVPADADLVVLGNPTNPTGVLHARATVRALARPGRTVVVDEAFMDAVPGEPDSLAPGAPAGSGDQGILVVRSLTKHWSIPGLRAGYVLGDATTIGALRREQSPWSVSSPAAAAMTALATPRAAQEARARADAIVGWREKLEAGLAERAIPYLPSSASFVLARPGEHLRERLRARGVAVRRADTFPGLGPAWVRIAVRPPETLDLLFTALDDLNRGEP